MSVPRTAHENGIQVAADDAAAPAGVIGVEERLAAVRAAVGSQRLEGLEPSGLLVAQLERVARGELTLDEVLADVRARVARGEV